MIRKLGYTASNVSCVSLSGWGPNTSKTGGLPHITHEPHKPVPIGNMLRNTVKCTTGIFEYHDAVDNSSHWYQKSIQTYLCTLTCLAKKIYPTTQQKSSSGWGFKLGRRWVGSRRCLVWAHWILCTIEKWSWMLFTFLSNLILSNNPVWILHVIQSQSEPFLHSLPKATNEVSYHYLSVLLRCVSHLVGYWVVMTATISDVPLYVMVNTWSSRKFHFVVGL